MTEDFRPVHFILLPFIRIRIAWFTNQCCASDKLPDTSLHLVVVVAMGVASAVPEVEYGDLTDHQPDDAPGREPAAPLPGPACQRRHQRPVGVADAVDAALKHRLEVNVARQRSKDVANQLLKLLWVCTVGKA